jgi:hypothetical protein
MSDIVKRLRELEELHFNPCTPIIMDNGLTMEMVHGFSIMNKSSLQIEASDEIARLRAEVDRYRAGLQKIVDADGWWDAPSLARDLLDGKDVK